MITFERQHIVTKTYSISLKQFMASHYAGWQMDSEDCRNLLIYTHSYQQGNMSYVMDVPLLPNRDPDLYEDMYFMIAKALKQEDN